MEGNWGMVIDLVTTIMAAVSYGYYHWQFFSFADDFLDRTVSKRQMLLTFFINYAVLFLCSVLEFHLIVNWSVVFIVLWGEIRIIYKEKFLQSIYVALAGASNGLALNIILRCAFSIAQDLPPVSYTHLEYRAVI